MIISSLSFSFVLRFSFQRPLSLHRFRFLYVSSVMLDECVLLLCDLSSPASSFQLRRTAEKRTLTKRTAIAAHTVHSIEASFSSSSLRSTVSHGNEPNGNHLAMKKKEERKEKGEPSRATPYTRVYAPRNGLLRQPQAAYLYTYMHARLAAYRVSPTWKWSICLTNVGPRFVPRYFSSAFVRCLSR